MYKNSLKQLFLFFLFIAVLCTTASEYTIAKSAKGGKSVHTQLHFKVVIPKSLSLHIQVLQPDSSLSTHPGSKINNRSSSSTNMKRVFVQGYFNKTKATAVLFLNILPTENFDQKDDRHKISSANNNIRVFQPGLYKNSESLPSPTSLQSQYSITYSPKNLKMISDRKEVHYWIFCYP
jgi:hypothetical protein